MTTQKKFLRGYIVKNYLVGEINLWWAKVYWGEILPLGGGGGGGGGGGRVNKFWMVEVILPYPSSRKTLLTPPSFYPFHTKGSFPPTVEQFSCFNPIKTLFLAVVITVATRLVITMAYTNSIVY